MSADNSWDTAMPPGRTCRPRIELESLPAWWLGLFGLVAIAGAALGWSRGQLPRRDAPTLPAASSTVIAPDLALYSEVIAGVRGGQNYYEVAAEAIPRYGFPTSSPLNWRLPTYAWVLSCLPCPGWIQLTLIALSFLAAGLAVSAKGKAEGPFAAFLCGFLVCGVVKWAADGYACLAQEPWAATLLLLSLACHAHGERHWRWRVAAVLCGGAALLFRELALPYCAAGCLVTGLGRRWGECVGWALCVAVFCVFFGWHTMQVQAHATGVAAATSASGLEQWLRLGGIDFVLLTIRMNGLLFTAPGVLLWAYLLVALLGLSRNRTDTGSLACLAAIGYLLAFAFLGRSENFYWGLLPAPLLAWGAASGPLAASELFHSLRQPPAQLTSAAGSVPAALT